MHAFQDTPPSHNSLPLSFGVEKALIAKLGEQTDITESVLTAAVKESFQLAFTSKEVSHCLTSLIARVVARIEELKAQTEKKAPLPRMGKSFSSEFSNWLSSLDSEQVCLYLADFDPIKAHDLYWRTDIQHIQTAVKLKTQYDSQRALLQMESCMYGFGGKYQDDEGNARYHDLSTSEGRDALKSFGF